MSLFIKPIFVAAASITVFATTTLSHAAFYSGWSYAGIEIPSEGQPSAAQGNITNHTGVGKLLYTGKTWTSYSPHAVRNEGEYITSSVSNNMDRTPFKGMELYLWSSPSVYSGSYYRYIDFTLKMPGVSDQFKFNLELIDYGSSIKLNVLDGLADPIIDYKGKEYQLEMLGFSNNNGNTICDSWCSPDYQAKTADVMFQLKEYHAPQVPTPASASITLGLLGFAALKRRRRA
ncbi:hypothetical protein JD969_08855 [Planctomycetota bacterium]|nr:hypothetical protein JD969_08855 [Planctomycetota bacterium]